MLVQALAEYADTYLAAQLGDPAFEDKPVGWVINIYPDGKFAGLGRRTREVRRGKKTWPEDLPLSVPKSPINRNSSCYALPGCDAVAYLVGPGDAWSTEKEPKKKENETKRHTDHHADFVSKVRLIAETLKVPTWISAAQFFEDAAEVGKARAALEAEKVKGSVTIAIVPIHAGAGSVPTLVEDGDFRKWWRGRYRSDADARIDPASSAMCLISGRVGPVAETHNKIKGVNALGGESFGVSLMSFDKQAFQSYGWRKNRNSPVSPDRATAYVLALNDLLDSGPHRRGATDDKLVTTRMDVAGTGFLFWSTRPTDDDLLSLIREPNEDSVRSLFDSVRTGRAPDELEASQVYLLAVACNGARLVVRHWSHDSLANMRGRIADWFKQLRIADVFAHGGVAESFRLSELVLATQRDGVVLEDVPAVRGLELVRRAFEGALLGHSLLAALLARLRVASGGARLAPTRIALVRMCVNDIATRSGSGETQMTETLDGALKNPAYLCGRLLAVFDALQYAAQGDVGVTVVDRYYALASTNPTVAFPKIEQLGQHHLKKLRRDKGGVAHAIEGRLAELHASIAQQGGRFPGPLCLEDQGRFAIGFHHQKADDRARIAERKAQKQAEQETQ